MVREAASAIVDCDHPARAACCALSQSLRKNIEIVAIAGQARQADDGGKVAGPGSIGARMQAQSVGGGNEMALGLCALIHNCLCMIASASWTGKSQTIADFAVQQNSQ
jgi:hypothetical protein